jgi:hypothetical protein
MERWSYMVRILKGAVVTYLKMDLITQNSLKIYKDNHKNTSGGKPAGIRHGYLWNTNLKEHWHFTSWFVWNVYVTTLY